MGRHQRDIEDLDAAVVLISFGAPYWAQVWRQKTASPYPLFLDSERAAYRAFGLDRSFGRSWGWQSIRYYARAILNRRGKVILNRGDTSQMGGDFVIDGDGIVRFAYRGRDPTDRPSIDSLLDALG